MKRGLSQMVSAILLIALTIVVAGIIWNLVDNLVEDKLDESESCYNLFEKIRINEDYTCYNSTGDFLEISINREDVDLGSLLISVSWGNGSKVVEIFENVTLNSEAEYLIGGSNNIKLPSKEGGTTYKILEVGYFPTEIKIAPKVNENQCDVSDSLYEISPCI